MIAREIIDFVANKLCLQAEQSYDGFGCSAEGGSCKYRGPNGLKCAIGWLIRDVDYKLEMENKGLIALLRKYPILDYILPEDMDAEKGINLLGRMQAIHDVHPVEEWTPEFEKLR